MKKIKKRRKQIILQLLIAIIITGLVWWMVSYQSTPGKYDIFAQCLKDEGAIFYGTFWCSHCQNQKAMFGKSAKLLPYVECSTPNGQGQLQICKDQNIAGYPTWEFTDGSRDGGELSLTYLSEKTGCILP